MIRYKKKKIWLLNPSWETQEDVLNCASICILICVPTQNNQVDNSAVEKATKLVYLLMGVKGQRAEGLSLKFPIRNHFLEFFSQCIVAILKAWHVHYSVISPKA